MSENLPEENESNEVGQHAVIAFNALHPLSWRLKSLDGDTDAGLDFQVQLVKDSKYSNCFHVQLKGSREGENGRSKYLNSDGTFYSVTLKTRTLNYYIKTGFPVMLVFVDLTQNENPRACEAYYQWISEEILELSNGKKDLNHLGTQTHTFRVPVSNKLDPNYDVSIKLDQLYKKKIVLDQMYGIVEMGDSDPMATIEKISANFSSKKVAIQTASNITENPWLDAPPNTIASKLLQSLRLIQGNNLEAAKAELERIQRNFEGATDHEKSEFYYQVGTIKQMEGDFNGGVADFEKAKETSPAIKKYDVSFIESLIHANYSDKQKCKELFKLIEGKEGDGYLQLRIKLLTLTGHIDKALILLKDVNETGKDVLHCQILLMGGQNDDCIRTSRDLLGKNLLNKKNEIIVRIFLARSLFSIGAGKTFNSNPDKEIPMSGLPDMDTEILRESWEEVLNIWRLAQELNYPPSLEMIMDLVGIMSRYFEGTPSIYQDLKIFSKKYPNLTNCHDTLFQLALQTHDVETIGTLLSKFPVSVETTVREILYNVISDNKLKAVKITMSSLDQLRSSLSFRSSAVLGMAAQCANELAMVQERDVLLGALQQKGEKGIIAIYESIKTLEENPLNFEVAINHLWKTIESGVNDRQLLAQFISMLKPSERQHAQYIFHCVREIEKDRALTLSEFVKLIEAYGNENDWDSVLTHVSRAEKRFGNIAVLKSLKAWALDSKGLTPEALTILEAAFKAETIGLGSIQLYANIAARCGFADKAVALLRQILEKAEDRSKKAQIFRAIFALEQSIDPQSPHLIEIWRQYGLFNDRDDEEEEGLYLQLFFSATITQENDVGGNYRGEFQNRFSEFSRKFPHSKVIRSVQFNSDDNGEDLLEKLKELSGMTEERLLWYKKNETLLKSGRLPIPYSLRPQFLLNYRDLLYLWEASKASSRSHNELALPLSTNIYQLRELNRYQGKIVLFEEVSIMILYDLGVLEMIFDCLDRFAIPKNVLLRFRVWAHQPFGSLFSQKAKGICEIISKYIMKILQPSEGKIESSSVNLKDLEELKSIISTGNYILCAEDVFTRHVVCEDNPNLSVTSLDIINYLRVKGVISNVEAAGKVACLCSWGVKGVPINFVDILNLLRGVFSAFTGSEPVRKVLEALDSCKPFKDVFDSVWCADEDHKKIYNELASFLGYVILEIDGVKAENNIVCGFWLKWIFKIQLHPKAGESQVNILAASFFGVCIRILSSEPSLDTHSALSRRTWGIFNSAVEYLFGERLDDNKVVEIQEGIIQFAIESDLKIRDKVIAFMGNGFYEGSADYDRFYKLYSNQLIRDASRRKTR